MYAWMLYFKIKMLGCGIEKRGHQRVPKRLIFWTEIETHTSSGPPSDRIKPRCVAAWPLFDHRYEPVDRYCWRYGSIIWRELGGARRHSVHAVHAV